MSSQPLAQLKSLTGPVLITGHTGFKGCWITLLLEKIGVEWVGISLPPKSDSLYNLIGKNKYQKEYFGDIRDYNLIKKIVNEINPKYIIHLAAQSLVIDSYKIPKETFDVNIMGTANLLEILIDSSFTQKIIVATTDKVYKEKNSKKAFKEFDALGGKDPYSWSKVGTEATIGAWQQISSIKNGPSIVSVRAGNVVGGGDFSSNRLLPDLVKGFISNSHVIIRNQKSTRPWQHVLDPIYGYLLASLDKTNEKAFNFSPRSRSLSVEDVTEIARKSWAGPTYVTMNESENFLETKSLTLNSSLAKRKLKWKSFWTQEESIQSTINWWKSVSKNECTAREACMKDIEHLLREVKK